MKKNTIKLAALATVMLSGSVFAQQDGTLNVTGAVSTVSCDVSLNGVGTTLPLGTWVPGRFTTSTTVVGERNFTVSLQNCEGAILKGQGVELNVIGAQGAFSQDQNLWGGVAPTNVGIALNASVTGRDGGVTNTPVTAANNQIPLYTNTTDNETEANTVALPVVPFQIGLRMASGATKATTGAVAEQFIFRAVYN
ncbi:major fimbrial protein StkA [Cedecea lapagei]|uniref:Major fimbrial protein StkA n=1 Tax=Cedecea lapagei TaxID=158823 RepID=A0A3S4J5J5_9ENTR|nr:type 1 fimbrial protein [Cedecea lapagei]VEC01364.1 major fimbrial protein StkA [Cedecea lapagei]